MKTISAEYLTTLFCMFSNPHTADVPETAVLMYLIFPMPENASSPSTTFVYPYLFFKPKTVSFPQSGRNGDASDKAELFQPKVILSP
jgi:hypothetical protein